MKITAHKYNSIRFKLAIVFVLSILLQCILMSITLILGGVVEQTRDNAFEFFSEKVNRRKNDLEHEMKDRWTNLDSCSIKISQYFSAHRGPNAANPQENDALLEGVAPYLISALRSAKTTGVFLILNDNGENDPTHSALYIRNTDPNKNSEDTTGLSMMAGPWNVARSIGLITDIKWNIRLLLDQENELFYRKPYEKIGLTEDRHLLGYWSAPFRLIPDDEKIITYSVPLTDEQGEAIGVFGVEISVNYLYKLLPATDLQLQDGYGYIIGRRSAADAPIEPIVTRGALQARMLQLGKPLSLQLENEENDIYSINNHNGQHQIYSYMSKLGLYYNNTPFDHEEWFLIGLMEESELLQLPNRITRILLLSFFISLCMGGLIAIGISRWFTKPIIDLANQVNKNSSGDLQLLSNTGLAEIDDLSATIKRSQQRLITLSTKLSRIIELTKIPFGAFEISNNSERVFMTERLPLLFNLSKEEMLTLRWDKNKFNERLAEIRRAESEEADVFHLVDETGEKWIRLTQTETEDAVLGIVMDVTDAFLHARDLRLERDQDPLTGIKNRNGFKDTLSLYHDRIKEGLTVGIGMFDLNGLKYINDHYGHSKGDAYICFSSALICSTFPDCPVFRIGGDEFVAIFVNMDSAQIDKLQQDMAARIEEYNENNNLAAGIAFGYSFYDQTRDTCLEDVLARADSSMYLNKKKMKEALRSGAYRV